MPGDETMEVDVRGISEVQHYLHNQSQGKRRALLSAGRDVGLLVQRDARRLAPYREGNLERGISYQADEQGVRIFVPINHAAGQYAEEKHNGNYALGRLSREKGPDVGPKFISRAIEADTAKIVSIYKTKVGTI